MGEQSIMRTGPLETQKAGACIAAYLAFCMLVYGLFGLGFYQMLQPHQIANVGLAAYKPPVAAVRGHDPTERVARIGRMLTDEGSDESSGETTVASHALMSVVTEAEHN